MRPAPPPVERIHALDLPNRLGALADAMNRRPRLWLTVFALLLAAQISPWWYPSNDGCTYLAMARRIATGDLLEQYRQQGVGLPPGYPLLVGPTFLLSDHPFLALSIVHWLLGAALLVGVYRWARRQCPEAAVLTAGLVLFNAALLYNYRRTLKEIAFLTALVWAAEALEALARSTRWRELMWRLVPAVLLLVLVILIRYSGIVLFAGFVAAVLLRLWHHSTRRAQAVTAASILGTAAVLALGLLIYFGGYIYLQGFAGTLGELPARLAEGLQVRISDIGRVSVAGMFKSYNDDGDWLNINMAVFLPVSLLVAAGWWRIGGRRHDVLSLTLPFYFALYVVWPFGQAARFMVPMLPVLVVCIWHGMQACGRWRPAFFLISLAAHFGTSAGYWLAVDAPRAMACDRYWPAVRELCDEIRRNPQPVVVGDVTDRWDVANEVRNMLEFTLDRGIAHRWTDADPLPTVQWIIQRDTKPVPPGFTVQQVAQHLALLHRTPPETAAAETPAVQR